jgi:ribosome-associated protein
MTENKSINATEEIVDSIIKGIQEKKGKKIVNLDLSKIDNAVCKNFVVCHGDSNRQVAAISDSVQEFVRKNTKEKPWHKEGEQNADWILLDYSDVVVHIFREETRKFYNIEGLWADAEVAEINS